VPTLVVNRAGDLLVPSDASRHVAEHIPGARYVELPGDDYFPWVKDCEDLLEVVEEFVTGRRPVVVDTDRVLTTVLFTDIVGSTEQVSELGDRRWRALLDAHDRLAAHEVERFRGRLIKTTGDGILATFDGPARAIRCAQAIGVGTSPLGLEIRGGLHTGEIERRGDDVSGVAVHLAQRVCSLAAGSEVLVSRTIVDLVAGSGIHFDERGEHELKGVPGTWGLFSVRSA
jgi:class 3 adenylate cyclase